MQTRSRYDSSVDATPHLQHAATAASRKELAISRCIDCSQIGPELADQLRSRIVVPQNGRRVGPARLAH